MKAFLIKDIVLARPNKTSVVIEAGTLVTLRYSIIIKDQLMAFSEDHSKDIYWFDVSKDELGVIDVSRSEGLAA